MTHVVVNESGNKTLVGAWLKLTQSNFKPYLEDGVEAQRQDGEEVSERGGGSWVGVYSMGVTVSVWKSSFC